MGAAYGHAEENRAYGHFCPWFHVRALTPIFTFSGADIHVHSVCIITTIRLILSAQLKLDDYTYDISRIAIVTILEPLLGITIACLPLFPPAIKKLTARKSESETRNVFPSSITARLRLKKSQSSALQGFDDSFPLTDLEAKGTINHITGPSGESDYLSEGYGHFAGIRIPPQSSIMVEQDWEVRSDGARHLEEKL